MTHPTDSISEADLHAYVDDQLTPARRIAVEEFLSQRPKLAAQVMADLRSRDELRLAMSEKPAYARLSTQDAARRLGGAMVWGGYLRQIRRAAAVILLIGVGWFAHVEFLAMSNGNGRTASAMPAYVNEAARAHRTALLRASMQSQPLQPNYDPAEIRAATSIKLPDLPEDWQVLDVQVFPSSSGPAVEMAVEAKDLGTLSLFAVRPGDFDVMPARVTSSEEVTTAYWQIGDVAYALVGGAEAEALNEAAVKLASRLY